MKRIKLTKNCILPWSYMLIHAGGLMQTCPCASDVEIGDFIIDFFECGEKENILNRQSLQMVREGILSCDLRPMCRNCAFADPKLITTDELKERLIKHLEEHNVNYKYVPGDDLRKVYAYDTVGLSLSNRCNLRCIYCNQSTCADSNPFYRAEYPIEYAKETLEFFINRGVRTIITSVEGEVTIYPHWYEVYSELLEKHPEVNLSLTTNLNREYSEQEIELLARHRRLDISCDSLDENIYRTLRVNGRLELLLKNVEKIKKKILELKTGCEITIHVVVCNLSWKTIDKVSEYAFVNGFGLNIGNYEERPNALGFREGILKPVSALPYNIQVEVSEKLTNIKEKAEKEGLIEKGLFVCHGDIISRISKNVEKKYHRFAPGILKNPVYEKYAEADPLGSEECHLDIIYDDYNLAYLGILFSKPQMFYLDGLSEIKRVIVRQVIVYKQGYCSPKYDQTVVPKYRRIIGIHDGVFQEKIEFADESVEKVLLEVYALEG